jgi:2-oxoisovalerate dehydrogenase E2 component (dihydrolipoyl transacylase)
VSELKQFLLPDVGEGLTEADIVKWHVQPGDTVTINQIIVEIETAKAVVELPSPYEGVVAGLLVPEGETADVGTPIIAVEVGADAGGGPPSAPQGSTSADLVPPPPAAGGADQAGGVEPGIHGVLTPKDDERQSVLVGYGVKPSATTRRPRKTAATAAPSAAGAATRAPATSAPAATAPATHAPATPTTHAPATSAPPATHAPATSARPATHAPATSAAPATHAPATSAAPATHAPATPDPAAARSTPAPAVPASAAPSATPGNGTSVLAKPPVRKLAKDLGIDLSRLSGTGPGGSVTRDDVQSAAHGQEAAKPGQVVAPAGPPTSPAQLAAVTAVAREERIPIRGVRKHTAAAMVASAFTAPHVTEFLQIDMTETMAATARLRSLPEFGDVRVSPLLLVAKALMVAVARHPMVNSSWDEDAQEIVVKHYVNLGIAVATDRGLVVPNVRDAHALSLPGLAHTLAELTETARAGKATPADLSGGTITITNVGIFGVDTGTPILSPGEAAILAFGRVKDAPWVHEGQLAVRKVTTLALSFDHRIVDGDLGSAVLRDVGAMLEDPLRMLAWS